jgi:ATP-dependent Lhr-like helicase
MALPITIETRTGDTPLHKRQRQKLKPPDILLTTPEQAALLLSATDADRFFADLDMVVLDELHALVTSKRGDLLSLGLARLRQLAPHLKAIGLSATVAEPDALRAWIMSGYPPPRSGGGGPAKPVEGAHDGRGVPGRAERRLREREETEAAPSTALRAVPLPRPFGTGEALADLVVVKGGARPDISILDSAERLPWSGHTARYALPDIYALIGQHHMTLVFVNVRSQAELLFQELWRINTEGHPIALHHGSLDAAQRRKVEAAMSAGKLRAVVCTSTLDLGIDWGDVDLVLNVGAPKGASRLAQRIGRANHRLDEPSKAILVPANRFEVMECRAALDANYIGAQDTPPIRDGSLDVLAQHVLGMACSAPFSADQLYAETISAYPYRHLDRTTFDRVVEFVATGGYALKTYERFAKIRQGIDGLWRITHPNVAQQYRLNVGTIIESALLNVRVSRSPKQGFAGRGGRVLGKIEEYFIEQLAVGDTFLFGGLVLRFEGIHENEAIATRTADAEPKIPIYAGGKFPLSTYLAEGVRTMVADERKWKKLPEQVSFWLEMQKRRSILPKREQLLVETFPRGNRFFMVAYPFEGRLAHQTLGMLLTRRLERAKLRPTGFVASDYALGVWGLGDLAAAFKAGKPSLAQLFDEDMLGDDLEAWMADSYLLKRMFRNVAQISGLVEKRHPGREKTGRQVTVSTDLIYDVLRRHEPDHILMRATWADAATGLLDIGRLGDMLKRIKGRIVHKALDRISPLAVPVMVDIGKEAIAGEAGDDVLREAAEDLEREAMGDG